MSVWLAKCLEIEVSPWEEQLAASAYISGAHALDSILGYGHACRVRALLAKLEALPRTLARGLCLEVLMRSSPEEGL